MTISVSGCVERWTNRGQGYPGASTWRGWRCTRDPNHVGPCALLPRWWNLRGLLQQLRRTRPGPR